jgi:hypothetical protein
MEPGTAGTCEVGCEARHENGYGLATCSAAARTGTQKQIRQKKVDRQGRDRQDRNDRDKDAKKKIPP